MKIAVYHGLLLIHYEMLLYLIDYFKTINDNITINYYLKKKFVEVSGVNIYNGWVLQYMKINKNINIKLIYDFNPENYDLIYLITDDDNTFKDEWFINHGNKIISIKHCHIDRTHPVYLSINTRYIFDQPGNKWVIPVYNGISKNDKFDLISKSNKIKVLSVGKVFPLSYTYLYNIFENIDDIEFNIVTLSFDSIKKFDFKKLEHPNINIHINIYVEKFINLLKESSYVIICDIDNNYVDNMNNDNDNNKKFNIDIDNYKQNHRISYVIQSGLHLGISHGCKLLLPSRYNKYYGLRDAITYNERASPDIIDDNNNKIKLEKITIESLNNTYTQLYELINHRNITFDNIINNKNLPRVFITFNEEYINSHTNFRERYWITNIFYNSNIETFNNIQFIYRINAPILFVFKYEDESFINTIILLNIRQHPDIIIIYVDNDNYSNLIKNLHDYYTKMAYIDYNNNKLTIVPHK